MIIRFAPLATAGLVALVGINAWLCAVILEGLLAPDPISTAEERSRPMLPTPAEDITNTKAIMEYNEMLVRPIFFKSRKLFVAPRPPPSPSAPPPRAGPASAPINPGLIVGGIAIIGPMRKTYLLRKADPSGVWVNQGDAFMGWKVQSIDPKGVTLRKDERAIDLRLYPEP
jgi:hypothetical protein